MREHVLEPAHPHVARSLNNLAKRSQAQSHSAEALLISQQALAMREQAGGPTHPEMADHADGSKRP